MNSSNLEGSASRIWLDRLTTLLGLIGGVLIMVAALLVTVSVVGLWLFLKPVPAMTEFVEILIGVAVFAFLSLTQARNGHIAVDTFTLNLPPRVNSVIDGVWDLVLAAFLALFTWGLWTGGLEKRQFGETLNQLAWQIWPVYIVCAVLAALACLTGLAVGLIKIFGK